MIVEGFKFAIGIGSGCVLLLIGALIASVVIFRLERLAYRRGWIEEPNRAMPKAKSLHTVVPFSPRQAAASPPQTKAE